MQIIHNPASPEQLLAAALDFARRGWHILPCHSLDPYTGACTCGNQNCSSPGKHPLLPNGCHGATTDETIITRWWTEAPQANIGIRTGPESGIFVLDCDGQAGIEALFKLAGAEDPITPSAKTGGEGLHIYYRYPNDAEIGNRAKIGGHPIDCRGAGGYILAPPSWHRSGRRYLWQFHQNVEPAQAPQWILDLVTTRNGNGHANGSTPSIVVTGQDIPARVRAYLAKCPPAVSGQGGHNHTFAICCAILHGFSLTPEQALPYMAEWNRTCLPPWTEKDLLHKLRDAANAEGERGRLLAGARLITLAMPSAVPAAFADPVPASELAAFGSSTDWTVHGYIGTGLVTLLIALWKSGKSTFVGILCAALEHGRTFIGQSTRSTKILVVSEEPRIKWAERRDRIGIADHAHFYPRDLLPFTGRPSMADWTRFVEHLVGLVKNRGYQLVIFDTFARLSPCDNENDAAAMQAALSPLHLLTGAGAAVLVVHHPKKGDATEGQASRGSGAMPGFVDIIAEMRRTMPGDRTCRSRTITTYSRFDETPEELVIELDDAGTNYRAIGSRIDAERQARIATVQCLLPKDEADACDIDKLLADWPSEIKKPGKSRLQELLTKGIGQDYWHRKGSGAKGEGYLYWKPDSILPP